MRRANCPRFSTSFTSWELILDTVLEEGFLENPKILASSEEYEMGDRSFSLLRLRMGEKSHARAASWKKREQQLGTSGAAKESRES